MSHDHEHNSAKPSLKLQTDKLISESLFLYVTVVYLSHDKVLYIMPCKNWLLSDLSMEDRLASTLICEGYSTRFPAHT